MISAGRACQLLVPPSFLCFLVTLFFSRTLIPVTCLRKVRISENPNPGSCLYPTNMVCIRTLLLVEASCWSCLCWSSSFWSLTSSPRAPLLTVARYDAIWLFVIMYLYVSQSLCCFFLNWCLLVSNMSISGRTFNLVVRKFMRRHHPGVRRPCLGYQRGGQGPLFDVIINRDRSWWLRCKLCHGWWRVPQKISWVALNNNKCFTYILFVFSEHSWYL